jgi:asparagine synthase (glutamine-hydrolysing)
MCGITGIFSSDRSLKDGFSPIKQMTNALKHRGPDDEGIFVDENIALGFRRLSIVDLSGGAQPMFSNDRTIAMICNGEIYNYRELRREMELLGYAFKTCCDVEVIIYLYQHYGTDFISRLNGQFAFAIYDSQKNRLLLARDHVGICPLFYSTVEGQIIFGSEIKAILAHPGVRRSVNLKGLDQIISFPGLVSPTTMFDSIHALQPGHYISIESGNVRDVEYWDLEYPVQQLRMDEGECIEELTEHLLKSVKLRLQADVPIGFYLSGGLDSSLLAGVMHHIEQKGSNAFSIRFSQSDLDEYKYQRLMASKVSAIHHTSLFEDIDFYSALQKAVYYAESPLKESYNTCSLALSKLVDSHKIKVVVSGEGADELFAGYVGYRFDVHRNGTQLFADARTLMEENLREELWGDRDFVYDKNYYEFEENKLALYNDRLGSRFDSFNSVKRGLVKVSNLMGRDKLQKRSYLDFKLRISDHLVADHGDRVAYANSVEARYPFLDIDLINFVRTIPSDLKLKKLEEKYILKACARRFVPPEIIYREKFSFVAPSSAQLLRRYPEVARDLLSYDRIKRQGYFNPDTVERLVNQYLHNGFNLNQTFETDLLMIVITFGLFLDMFSLPSL